MDLNKEQTCVIIKPDGVCKKLVGEIIRRFEKEGFKLVGAKMLKPTRAQLEEFYKVHSGKEYFKPFIDFMISAPIIATVFEGENAILRIREIIGATDSRLAKPHTLRGMFGSDDRRNLVHASDSKETAEREIRFFFSLSEIFDYAEDAWKPKV